MKLNRFVEIGSVVLILAICISVVVIGFGLVPSNAKDDVSGNNTQISTNVVDGSTVEMSEKSKTLSNISSLTGEYPSTNNSRVQTFTVKDTEISSTVMYNIANYPDVEFYVFDNTEDAKKVYNKLKNSLINTEDHDTWVYGLDGDAVDIEIQEFYVLSNNLIISHVDAISDPGNSIELNEYSLEEIDNIHEQLVNISESIFEDVETP